MTDPLQNERLKFLFALPGFHQEDRGAEVALLSVADELAKGGDKVTVLGMGEPRAGTAYEFRHVGGVPRHKLEWLPRLPPLRSETVWEDAGFAWGLRNAYRPDEFDVTITCNFPFTHWALRRGGRKRPAHFFVTQNGDWPAHSDKAEFRYFACDGLVCTNPDYEERNRARWNTALIPNGVDPARYSSVPGDRARFGLPMDKPVVLMVSAFIETKRVLDGMRAVAPLDGVHFAVAGDGPLRSEVDALAEQLLPDRFTRMTLTADQMPVLYRSADTFLHMSLQESFGNVYVESMASGLPIVAQDSARLRWIVGDRPTLCDTKNRAELTDTIKAALDKGLGEPDPRAQQFAWPNIARQYREFAAKILAERRRA